MLTICTGWSPAGWAGYAHRFVETLQRWRGDGLRVLAYTEEPQSIDGIEVRPVLDIPGCRDFIEKFRQDERANGRDVQPTWKPNCIEAGYNFKFDAWKFSRQGFIPLAAAQECDTEFLAWFDADVVFHGPVSGRRIAALLPLHAPLAYLGRGDKWSEIGFQLYRLPAALPMLQAFSDFYRRETVFELSEWHSAYVFDRARELSGIIGHDLTPGRTGTVWHRTGLARFCDHLKGKRKNGHRH